MIFISYNYNKIFFFCLRSGLTTYFYNSTLGFTEYNLLYYNINCAKVWSVRGYCSNIIYNIVVLLIIEYINDVGIVVINCNTKNTRKRLNTPSVFKNDEDIREILYLFQEQFPFSFQSIQVFQEFVWAFSLS